MMSKTLWLLSASLFVGLWGQAYADDGSNFQSEALIVTASKRAQALDSLDGQAVVMRGDDIGLSRASSVDQLGGVVGDLTVRQRASRTYLSLTLRGQSSVDFYNPTVQIYLDGVPQDQATFGQALPLNLQQVEVLYGPQSTLYGRGAMGGVINLVSSPPGLGWRLGESVPPAVLRFLADQVHVAPSALDAYAKRPQTRLTHVRQLHHRLALRPFNRTDLRHAVEVACAAARSTDKGGPIVEALIAELRRRVRRSSPNLALQPRHQDLGRRTDRLL